MLAPSFGDTMPLICSGTHSDVRRRIVTPPEGTIMRRASRYRRICVVVKNFVDYDQSGRTRSAGWATSQPALKSGTLTLEGTFTPMNWLFTDNPTTSVVGS